MFRQIPKQFCRCIFTDILYHARFSSFPSCQHFDKSLQFSADTCPSLVLAGLQPSPSQDHRRQTGILQRTLDQTGSAKCIFTAPVGKSNPTVSLCYFCQILCQLDPLFYAAVVNVRIDHFSCQRFIRIFGMRSSGNHRQTNSQAEICIF